MNPFVLGAADRSCTCAGYHDSLRALIDGGLDQIAAGSLIDENHIDARQPVIVADVELRRCGVSLDALTVVDDPVGIDDAEDAVGTALEGFEPSASVLVTSRAALISSLRTTSAPRPRDAGRPPRGTPPRDWPRPRSRGCSDCASIRPRLPVCPSAPSNRESRRAPRGCRCRWSRRRPARSVFGPRTYSLTRFDERHPLLERELRAGHSRTAPPPGSPYCPTSGNELDQVLSGQASARAVRNRAAGGNQADAREGGRVRAVGFWPETDHAGQSERQ